MFLLDTTFVSHRGFFFGSPHVLATLSQEHRDDTQANKQDEYVSVIGEDRPAQGVASLLSQQLC